MQFSNLLKNELENKLDYFVWKYKVNYFTYLIMNKGQELFSFNSNSKWSEVYISERLYKDCPIMNYGLNCKDDVMYLEWSKIKPIDEAQLSVSLARKDFNVGDGVTLAFHHKENSISKISEGIAFAPDVDCNNFEKIMRMNQINIFKDFKDIRDKCLNDAILSLT